MVRTYQVWNGPREGETVLMGLHHDGISGEDDSGYRCRFGGQVRLGRRGFGQSVPVKNGRSGEMTDSISAGH